MKTSFLITYITMISMFLTPLLLHAGEKGIKTRRSQALGLLLLKKHKEAFIEYLKLAEANYPDAQAQVAIMYYHGQGTTKDIPKAILWAQKAAEHNNGNAALLLGEIHYKEKKDFKQATAYFKKACTLHVPLSYRWLKNILSDKKNPYYNPRTIEKYCSYGIKHKSEEATFVLIESWVETDRNLQLAEDLLIQLLKKSPFNGEYLKKYSLLLLKMKKYEAALTQARKAQKLLKNDIFLYSVMADTYYNLGKFKEAENTINKILLLTKDPEIHKNLKNILLRMKLSDAKYSKKIKHRFLGAQKLWRIKKYDEAIAIFNDLAKKQEPTSQLILGKIYYLGDNVSKDVSKARKWLKLAAGKCDGKAHFLLGEICYFHDNNTELAIKYWKQAIKLKNYRAYNYLATVYSDKKSEFYDLDKANFSCLRGILNGQDFCRYIQARIILNNGYSLYKLDIFIEKIHNKFRNNGKCVLTYADVLMAQKKYKKALKQFFNADKLLPNNPHIKESIGDTYCKLKQYKKAEKYYRLAITNAKDCPKMQELIAEKIDKVVKRQTW